MGDGKQCSEQRGLENQQHGQLADIRPAPERCHLASAIAREAAGELKKAKVLTYCSISKNRKSINWLG
jgi:hypothetical protein